MKNWSFYLVLVAISLWNCRQSYSQNKQVDTLIIQSSSMNKTINALVIKPLSYDANSVNKYNVVYVLHGYSDNYAFYYKQIPHLTNLSNDYNLILVFPDGGYSSWYIDSPIDPAWKYETHISKELIEYVDNNYNTRKDPKGRAITGHSMGGHGALYNAIRHTDVFGACGSMSGGVDLTYNVANWDLKKRLGDFAKNPAVWKENSVINLIETLKGKSLPMIVDCGTEDFFYEINKNLHAKMLKLKIPHDYIERPGFHNWDYWNNAIDYQVLFFHLFFNKN